jgi:hypothetical protein
MDAVLLNTSASRTAVTDGNRSSIICGTSVLAYRTFSAISAKSRTLFGFFVKNLRCVSVSLKVVSFPNE